MILPGEFPRQPRGSRKAGTVAAAQPLDAVTVKPLYRLPQLLGGAESQMGTADQCEDMLIYRMYHIFDCIDNPGVTTT